MRIRSIIPKFYESDDIGAMDWHTRLVFIGLWSYADDNGVGRDSSALIAADLFPLDLSRDSRETLARVAAALDTLAAGGQIVRYTRENKALYFVVKWDIYQRVDRPAKPRYERPTSTDTEARPTLATPSRQPRETVATGEGEKGRRGEGNKARSADASRGMRLPDDFAITEPMRTWAKTNAPWADLDRDTDSFRDYWTAITGAKGVKKDWVATWRNWMRNASDRVPSWKRQQPADEPRPNGWMQGPRKIPASWLEPEEAQA